jgi:serine/threonine protein kinase/uncharacterized protein YraI
MVDIDALAGKTIGQYTLRDLMGTGGMGAVYRAEQLALKRDVAVKILYSRLTNNAEHLARFNREALIAASLEHPHIVPVYDYGTADGISYVVMRLLTGGSLEDRFGYHRATNRPLPSVGEIMDVLRQLAAALDYAHSQGVIHRDIKDSNVMFDQHGTAFLVDFGIARLTEVTSQLTGTGMTIGTPSYMSPEQWRGDGAYPGSDQYSLGVMAFALLTGQLPYSAPNPHTLMYKHLNDDIPNPADLRPELGDTIYPIFQTVLAKSVYDRYDTVTEFVNVLAKHLPAEGTIEQLHVHTGFFTTDLPAAKKARNPAPQPSRPAPAATISASPVPASESAKRRTYAATPQKRGFPITAVVTAAVVLIMAGVLLISYAQSRQTPPGGLLVALGVVQAATTPAPTLAPTAIPATDALPTSAPTTAPTSIPPTEAPIPPTSTPTTAQITAIRDSVVIRSGPANAYAVVTRLDADDVVYISGVSEDGAWYQVQTADGIGWVLDSPSVAVAGNLRAVPVALAPTPTLPPSDTPTPRPSPTPTHTIPAQPVIQPTWTPIPNQPTAIAANLPNCPGALPSRLVPGTQGFVLENDPRPINIRQSPSTRANILSAAPIGTVFDVLEGPSCGEDIAWYRINYRGTRGWIAEGTETYFVVPITDEEVFGGTTSDRMVAEAITNLSSCSRVLLEEDFEFGSEIAWFRNTDSARYNVQIGDGAYQVNLNSLLPIGNADPVSWGSTQDYSFREGRLDAVIRTSQFTSRPTSRTGVWLRYQNEDNFLAFMILSNGKYRIARFMDGYDDLVGWTSTSAIVTGDNAVNTLSIEVEDDRFQFFINDQYVDEVIDGTWSNGRLAFFGSTTDQPATYALEHLRLCAN